MLLRAIVLIAALEPVASSGQVASSIDGTVFDESRAAIAGASISIQNAATNLNRFTTTNEVGRYHIAAVEVGVYRVVVSAPGFRTQVIERLQVEVGRDAIQDFTLSVGEVKDQVNVTANGAITDRATFAAGALINRQTIETTPLNGGHFTDLALLTPGSVTPPQSGALSPPRRGLGTFTINTGGNREDATNFLVNGVNMNDLLTNILIVQPTLSILQEFRIDTSTPSAEFGRTSGAVVNIVTRSGSNDRHGSGFELFRDDALDARNYFRPPSLETPPLRRHQFGGGVGGPIVRNRTFFFAAYEGVRQDQGLDVNTVVLSDTQRAAIVDPTMRRLATLVPQPNTIDSSGTARYIGFAAAPVSVDQAAIDITHSIGPDGRLHGFFAIQADESTEP